MAPDRRKEVEVALHAGTLAALGLPRPSVWLAIATLPAAVAGGLFERPIEERLGGPRTTAAGLLLGGVAMTLADHRGPSLRRASADPVVVGLAQACALVPGVSRHGAALTALRAMGVPRARAQALSRDASRPLLLGATLLKGARVLARRDGAAPFAVAACASAVSTGLALRRIPADLPLWPFAVYRAALAASVWRHG